MRKFMHFLIDGILATLLKIIGTCLLLDILLQIAGRYIHVIHATWTDEVARLLFVWFAMLSTALAYAKNAHLSIDVLYNKLPKKAQVFLDYFSVIAVMVSSFVLTWVGIKLLSIVKMQKAPILKISMTWFYLAVPVGFAFVVLFTVVQLLISIKERRNVSEIVIDEEEQK
ncbi:MAG: TRAP transporter small permease [Lachnospiraceae bacterium]|nr:TRAP transporter small permease [Lachnospiraceae bacterium]